MEQVRSIDPVKKDINNTVQLLLKMEETSIHVQKTEQILSLQLVKTCVLALCNFYIE